MKNSFGEVIFWKHSTEAERGTNDNKTKPMKYCKVIRISVGVCSNENNFGIDRTRFILFFGIGVTLGEKKFG